MSSAWLSPVARTASALFSSASSAASVPALSALSSRLSAIASASVSILSAVCSRSVLSHATSETRPAATIGMKSFFSAERPW
jgi:hypothetical protein